MNVDLKSKVVQVFKEYGGWWRSDLMANWLNSKYKDVRMVYDQLEKEGLLERKQRKITFNIYPRTSTKRKRVSFAANR